MGWTLLIGGFAIGALPTMVFQVWNGASLLGFALSVVGGMMLWREEANAD